MSLLALLMVAGLITACGATANAPKETAIPALTSLEPGDADIESGCWTATDRVNTEGDPELANIQQWSKPPEMQIDGSKTYTAKVETNKGDFTIQLLPSEAPLAVNNFVCLAKAGFFDNTPIHRIVAGFVIQGGDPTGTGRGGPGYRFEDETGNGLRHERGVLSMANAGPNTNGSQFFITHVPCGWLDGKHTVFGKVVEGLDVVDAVKQGDKIKSVKIEGDAAVVLAAKADRVAEWNKHLAA